MFHRGSVGCCRKAGKALRAHGTREFHSLVQPLARPCRPCTETAVGSVSGRFLEPLHHGACRRGQLQPAVCGRLQQGQGPGREEARRARGRPVGRGQGTGRLEQPACLARHGFARFHQAHLRAGVRAQRILGEDVMGTAEHERVDLAGGGAERAERRGVPGAERADLGGGRGVGVGVGRAALYGVGQPVAGLHHELDGTLQRGLQALELGARQCPARADHAHAAGARERQRRLECRLHADQRQAGMPGTHLMDGGRGRGVAGHHQGLDAVRLLQVRGDGMGACRHVGIAALAVGCVPAVGQVDEALVRQLGPQRAQHAQAADAAVEHADGLLRGGRHVRRPRGRST